MHFAGSVRQAISSKNDPFAAAYSFSAKTIVLTVATTVLSRRRIWSASSTSSAGGTSGARGASRRIAETTQAVATETSTGGGTFHHSTRSRADAGAHRLALTWSDGPGAGVPLPPGRARVVRRDVPGAHPRAGARLAGDPGGCFDARLRADRLGQDAVRVPGRHRPPDVRAGPAEARALPCAVRLAPAGARGRR